MASDLNYAPQGCARPGAPSVEGLTPRELSLALGFSDEVWARAVAVVEGWEIKKRVGFRVNPDVVAVGQDVDLRFGIGAIRLREPVRVIWVENSGSRRGFGYGTRAGHPITGEEAFLVERGDDGEVRFTVRSVSRVSGGRWRLLAPLIRPAQRLFMRRYARAARAIVLVRTSTDTPRTA